MSAMKVTTDLINKAKDKQLRVKGPVRHPTKVLSITTRKTVRLFAPFSLNMMGSRDSSSLAVKVQRLGIVTR